MVEKLTLNSLSTAPVDIPAVSMPIAHSLKTSVALCCVTSAHFKVAFYCPQHKVHLCNEHAVLTSLLICHTCLVDGLSWKRINAH